MLTIKQVLEQFPICRATLYARMKDGTFPKPHKIGKRLLWNERDIDVFAKTGISNFSKLSKAERQDILDDVSRLFGERNGRDANWTSTAEQSLAKERIPAKAALREIAVQLGLPANAASGAIVGRLLDLLNNYQRLQTWAKQAVEAMDKLRANTAIELVGVKPIPLQYKLPEPDSEQIKADIK